ncbi:MAG: molecular chaperone [Lysobacter sp.]|nr:molecular chaperone [Lysobacter sp.]MDQ3269257.1 fimbria/pilus periplasmic chaperone [Pseudomonadota bacterium]
MNPSRLARHLAVGAVSVLLLAAGAAHARGQLQTRQTGVDMPSGARAGRLVLANSGDEPVAAQIRVYTWTQENGEDRLEPAVDLLVSPPIVEIPAGGEQLIRLIRPDATPPAQELAYRVVVDELPGDNQASENAVAVRMRFLIPAFIRTADPAPPDLHCSVEENTLSCENRGSRAAQLGATVLQDANGNTFQVTPGLMGYVLAGSSRRWPLPAQGLATLETPRTLEVLLNGQSARIALREEK